MRRDDFTYTLPPELIAQAPLPERSASRLLCLDGTSGSLQDALFTALPDLLRPGDLLVFNDTRVLPARVFGHKASGGRVALLVERLLGPHTAARRRRPRARPRPPGRPLRTRTRTRARG